MNSTRIMDDEEFVERHKHLTKQDELSVIDKYNIRKLLAIYVTVYDLYLTYNKPNMDFSYISDDYNKLYTLYANLMVGKTKLRNQYIIDYYNDHMIILKKRVDISFEKRAKCRYI